MMKSKEFFEAFRLKGIIPESTRRMIIDVTSGEPVKIYYDTFASKTLLQNIDPAFLMNAEIVKHEEKDKSPLG